MRKSLLAVAAISFALLQPAFAQDAMMKCDNASMMKMQSDMTAMSVPDGQKTMAMNEMKMAKDSMTAGKMDDCTMHMNNAMKAMKKS